MPNWCMNSVTFTHVDPSEIVRLQEAYVRDELFSEFAPNPEGKDSENWYSYNTSAWGTKWDTGGTADMIHEQTSNKIVLSFDTAWSPPTKFYEHMESLGWEIEAYYYEPGMAFCGKYSSFGESGHFDIPECSDDVLMEIPTDIDEMFSISENMANNESEFEEDEDE